MATVFTEGLGKGRCGYCIYRRSEKGADVACNCIHRMPEMV